MSAGGLTPCRQPGPYTWRIFVEDEPREFNTIYRLGHGVFVPSLEGYTIVCHCQNGAELSLLKGQKLGRNPLCCK